MLREEAQRRYRYKLDSCGIPPRFMPARLAEISPAEGKRSALDLARLFAEAGEAEGFPCLMFAGDYGTGKTWLGTAVFKELVWKAVTGNFAPSLAGETDVFRIGHPADRFVWTKWYDVVREVQDTYGSGDLRVLEVMRRYQMARILMLDDIGGFERANTEDRRQILYEIIDYRNDRLMPTILTTNLDKSGMIDQFGERTYNRLIEMCKMVGVAGVNYRTERLRKPA